MVISEAVAFFAMIAWCVESAVTVRQNIRVH
jgi:hypothetical protein